MYVPVNLLTNSYLHVHTQTGDVPLGTAALKGHTQTVQRLLETRTNVNHQNKVMTSYSSDTASMTSANSPQTDQSPAVQH